MNNEPIAPPSRLHLALEGRGLFDIAGLMAAAPFLATAPRGERHPVMVLPGLGANDNSTFAIRGFLNMLGYDVKGWGRGRNIRLPQLEAPAVAQSIRDLSRKTGQRVSLIGWSLGGILAREVARRCPEHVRLVVTLGSPFAAPHANNLRTVWRLLTGQPSSMVTASRIAELSRPLPMPATAIYTRSDGIVAWQACLEQESPTNENIEVRTTHLGLGFHAPALWVIADRLAQPEGQWKPFKPSLLVSPFFPQSRQ